MTHEADERTDRELLRRVERSAGQRAGYKQLVRELGLGGGRERRVLLEQLNRLTQRGALVRGEDGLWALPSSVPERTARPKAGATADPAAAGGAGAGTQGKWDRLVAGRVELHRDGYGFVRPNGRSGREDDIFIPPVELHGAMHGDEVLVEEEPLDREGRRSGRIVRVLTRRNPTVVGVFHYSRVHGGGRRSRVNQWVGGALVRGNHVVPFDERMGGPIEIAEGDELSATVQDSENRVLGQEAMDARTEWTAAGGEDSLEGLAVDVEITAFPVGGKAARGRVIEVLGPPDAFGVDVEIMIRKHHLPHVFPAGVLAEAGSAALRTVAQEEGREQETDGEAADAGRRGSYGGLPDREDFRHLPIVTIDGESARDFDDAVLVRDLPNGSQELQVHIADVSHYVLPGTALDLEARLRGTSVYFPDRAVPMLPPALSTDICSLRPQEDRFVLSCIMEVDADGEIVQYRLSEGVIRSARRMTYTQVQQILDGAEAQSAADAREMRQQMGESAADFDRMYELALRLNRKRQRRGSIDFDMPEPVVQFDPQGNMQAIVRSERSWSHRLIEEFMLSANECVARWIENQAVPGIYRIHEMPDAKRIVEFEEAATAFGHTLGIGSLPVRRFAMKGDRRHALRQGSEQRRGGGQGRQEIPERIPVTPQMYQRLVAKISGTPEERLLSFLMLRSLKQARYSEKNEGHFALASPSYTHFTSPIRRYPDLMVHRLVRALLRSGAEARGGAITSRDAQPWREEVAQAEGRGGRAPGRVARNGPFSLEELSDVAVESSQAERRADDAERELVEWKKIKYMEDRVGEEFEATVLSCTKFGCFVELDALFIEGLVPITSLESLGGWREGEPYRFRDTDRSIVGLRSGRVFRLGTRVRVMLDRIDRQQRRLQFAVLEVLGEQEHVTTGEGSLRGTKRRLSPGEGKGRPTIPGGTKMKGKKGRSRLRNSKAKGRGRH